MVGWLLLIISVIFIFIGKSIADIVSNQANWYQAVFSKYPIDSFWGAKDHTWKRKYKNNKILNYIFTTILVWTTDIWHLANMIRRFGIYLAITGALMINYEINLIKIIIIVISYAIINIFGFHLCYKHILKK